MKVGFVGCGKMAESMISSFISSKVLVPHQLFASDISSERRALIKRLYGVNTYSKNSVVPGMAEVVFLAVKPQNLDAVLKELSGVVTSKHLMISIAAGRKIKTIESILADARVIRVMPNIGCLAGEAMSVFCTGRKATDTDGKTVVRLLSCFGQVRELPETNFDVVTALSGSGPAFFAFLLNLLVDAATDGGLTRKDALALAIQTMVGAARILSSGKMSPEELIEAVTSPKGTTAAGLKVLDDSDIAGILKRTIDAAADRSRELSS